MRSQTEPEDSPTDVEATAMLELVEPTNEPAAPKPHITYRGDIDGLRTLAVVPVVIFHAYPESIKGGFIGVDVFFVISGYLISSILFKENARGSFTYADFYSRRIRRIFPALVLVLSFSLVMGCVWLLDKAVQSMASTLVAGTLFGANIQLLTVQQGYFDASVKENPLLHLWSLGVEEQFYIFWPLFVSVVHRLSFRKAVACQVAVMVTSFACNVLFLGYNNDNKYSFYFPLSRFWQMAVGGLLAYVELPTLAGPSKYSSAALAAHPFASSVCSMCGFVAIIVGYVVIDETVAFPGFWSLLPTVGTACVVFAGPAPFINQYVLGNKLMVYIGQISYALYLWHWPLLVFAKLRYPRPDLRPTYMQPYSMVVLSVVLSIATLYLVENRLRRRKAAWLVPVLVGLMVVLCAVAAVVTKFPSAFSVPSAQLAAYVRPTFNQTTDVPNWSTPPRLSEPTMPKVLAAMNDWDPLVGFQGYNQDLSDDGNKVLNGDAPDSVPRVLVLGDSHANMVAPRFNRLLELATDANARFPKVFYRSRNGDPPLSCSSNHAADLAFIQQVQPKVVFYVTNWIQFLRPGGLQSHGTSPVCCLSGYRDKCTYQSKADVETLVTRFQQEIAALVASGTRVFVATVNPEGPSFNFNMMLNGNAVVAVHPVSRQAFRTQPHVALVLELVEAAVRNANATLVDFSVNQCHHDVCEVVSMVEGEPVFKDTDHFRPYFARNYLSTVDQVVDAAWDD
ncbi:hypothetical protein DYB28_001689 [Aphanomyces astaci]|uniref:Acyltransferase 3 domain-containing protein n=1 Tax=Aphanomyces astaci TaxID=112090 RepID=A0A9X8E2B8_APHAT|nr:hypothetical protein DYB28_001689 [Aphanomyces astaci]